jgi:predicted dehydrogenase
VTARSRSYTDGGAPARLAPVVASRPGGPTCAFPIRWIEEVAMSLSPTRRGFVRGAALGSVAALTGGRRAFADDPPGAKILGASGVETAERSAQVWQPVSDRKIRVGIAGFGVCQFGAAFGFQDHPNVTVAAVTDLFPDRCAALARACRCEKTYPSLEKMIEDDSLEAVFVATDAPSHAAQCIAALGKGKHVACAVPAVFGSVEDAHRLHEAVTSSGRTYMMFETSAYHHDCLAMRRIFQAGGFGALVYSEGEYYHYCPTPIASFRDWRVGPPPQWYPTHSNAYYVCVSGGRFTEVSCLGMPSRIPYLQPDANRYKNGFGTEIALLRTSEGGTARMAVSWDTPGHEGDTGRVRGQRGSMTRLEYVGEAKDLPNLSLPPLPPKVEPGGHGGSHGQLMNEFVTAILQKRKPLVDIAASLNMTVAGIVAHESALKGGETLKIPQFG